MQNISSRPVQPACSAARVLIAGAALTAAMAAPLAALAADGTAGASTVELSGNPPADKPRSSIGPTRPYDEKLAGPPPRGPNSTGNSLRCFQSGQMIFEGRGFAPLPASQVAADLKQADGSAPRVQLIELYDGLCVLEVTK